MNNDAYTIDITNEGESIFNNKTSFNSFTTYYKLFKLPVFSLDISTFSWLDIKDWKELKLTATLYDSWNFSFPLTITGVRIRNRSLILDGIICTKDNLLKKRTRFLGYDFIEAYSKLELPQKYNRQETVMLPKEDPNDPETWGNGFFQLNCTDTDMILMMMKGISKNYFVSMSCDELILLKYNEGKDKPQMGLTNSSISLLVNNLKYMTRIESNNPDISINSRILSSEVKSDGYLWYSKKHHKNYELRGIDSYYFNKELNDNIQHNTLLEDGLEYSHVIKFNQYQDAKLGDRIIYPMEDSDKRLMIIGKQVKLDKDTIESQIEVGVMTDEIN